MNQPEAAAANLLRVAAESETDGAFQAAVQSLFDSVRRGYKQDADSVLRLLACGIDLPSLERASTIAMCCGSLVESGADPTLMAGAITARLEQLLEQAARFREAWASYLPEDYADREEQDEHLEEQARSTAEAVSPVEAEAWTALQQFYLPGVAVYSRHVPSRVAARWLLEPALELSAAHQGGGQRLAGTNCQCTATNMKRVAGLIR